MPPDGLIMDDKKYATDGKVHGIQRLMAVNNQMQLSSHKSYELLSRKALASNTAQVRQPFLTPIAVGDPLHKEKGDQLAKAAAKNQELHAWQ